MAAKKIAKNIKFEEALNELEKQVELLEGGELSLDDAIAAFQYGTELGKICQERLNAAKKAVKVLEVPDPYGSDYKEENFKEDADKDGF